PRASRRRGASPGPRTGRHGAQAPPAPSARSSLRSRAAGRPPPSWSASSSWRGSGRRWKPRSGAAPPPSVVTLHPEAPALDRARVEHGERDIAEEKTTPAVMAAVRGLVQEIRLFALPHGEVDILILGDLAALLEISADQEAQVEVVAGT